MAPEYAMRGHLTEKADVFSFGVVALEILSGRPNSDNGLPEEQVYLLELVRIIIIIIYFILSFLSIVIFSFPNKVFTPMFCRHGICMKVTKVWH